MGGQRYGWHRGLSGGSRKRKRRSMRRIAG
jgi:hypothetical protein